MQDGKVIDVMRRCSALLLLLCAVFLSGCASGGGGSASSSTPASGEDVAAGGGVSYLGRLEESLGALPQSVPGRAVKGILVGQGDMETNLEDWGLAIGHLPNDCRIAYVIITSSEVSGDRILVGSGSDYSCPLGRVKVHDRSRKQILSECELCYSGNLSAAQLSRLELVLSLLLVKLGEVQVVPMFVGEGNAGDGKLNDFFGSLALCMSEPGTVMIGVMPEGHCSLGGTWRDDVRKVVGGSDGWGGLPKVAGALCAQAIGYKLSVFDLQRYPRPAPPRPAKSRPAPVRGRLESLLFLETVGTRELMGVVRESRPGFRDVLTFLRSRQGQVSGSYEGALLNREEELILLDLVRRVMSCSIAKTKAPDLPQYSRTLLEPYGCTITLVKDGKALGTLAQQPGKHPLSVLLVVTATKLCTNESRPITQDELRDSTIVIGVITPSRRLNYKTREELYSKLRPGRDGVVLRASGKKPVGFIPRVWKEIKEPRAFMLALCQRCGIGEEVLSEGTTEVSVFEVHEFRE
jgi:AMMECR1 domain-containing protein